MNLDPQQLGCYYMYKKLPPNLQIRSQDLMAKQIAMYTEFTSAIDKIYSSCISPSGEILKEPEMEKVEKWRKKLHSFLDECEEDWKLFIETEVCRSKKKSKKKRFKKIQQKDDFYRKHVWNQESNPEVFIKQVEFIMKDNCESNDKVGLDADGEFTEESDMG